MFVYIFCRVLRCNFDSYWQSMIIYTNKKLTLLVSLSGYSVVLGRIELKLGRVIGDRCPRGMVNFSKWPHQRSKVIQRSCCLRKALWLPNLVERTPDQSIMHWWGQMSCRGQRGQAEVKLLRNALWLPNLVERTPDQSIMHCLGQRSCRGQPRSTRGQIA